MIFPILKLAYFYSQLTLTFTQCISFLVWYNNRIIFFMEQYPIPQFIEQEGKVAFFISFRQFFYLVGAGIICFFLYFALPRPLFFLFSILVFIVAAALAFITINGAPLINILLNSVGFAASSKNYVWKKKESLYPFKTIKRVEIKKINEGSILKAQQGRLRKMKTGVELKTK